MNAGTGAGNGDGFAGAANAAESARRYRLRFAKLGKVRFTSHRDVARMWERALRRARLPVAYTQGFSPRPKLSFGLALPTGHESLAEYLDVELAEGAGDGPEAAELPARLSPELPVGVDVLAAAPVEPGGGSLQQIVRSCSWRIEVADLAHVRARCLVDAALAADEIVVTRQRKGRDVTDDLRPAVLSVAVVGPTPTGVELDAELAVHPRSVRPGELLRALAPDLSEGRVLRTAQWTWRDGARAEPLTAAVDLDATRHPHASPCVTRRDSPDARTRRTEHPVLERRHPRTLRSSP
ncbi:MAG: TIGR03936 family radical SAM-associated protein, partial [Actinomycetota bacterium]|nr:TIGR03936 family radical SAM-associated protein [Actinomycetota bacterium]